MSAIGDWAAAGAPDVVDAGDPRIAGVLVEECGEPLRDARGVPFLVVDDRNADPEGVFALVRVGTLDRLSIAARHLPPGWRLVVLEGWRPAVLQKRCFDEYAADLRRRFPDWDPGRLAGHAQRAVPLPDLAPHVTGGAVDLTLMTPANCLAWMGTEVNAYPEDCDEACRTDARHISVEAARHRQLLHRALSLSGLVNDPAKWWHWSFGDRYWAIRAGIPAARYGPIAGIYPA